MKVKSGWMIVLECECSPGNKIAFTKAEMGDVNVGQCKCGRPYVVAGVDGHLYMVGKRIITDAEA